MEAQTKMAKLELFPRYLVQLFQFEQNNNDCGFGGWKIVERTHHS